jgi:hypothetical protein
VDPNYLSALGKFDAKDFISAGAHLDLTPQPEGTAGSAVGRLRDSEVASLQVMVRAANSRGPGIPAGEGVPQDPLAPRRGPLGSSPDGGSAIGNAPALVPGPLAPL